LGAVADGVINTSLPIRTGWQILIEPNRYAARFQVVGQLEDEFDIFSGVADEHVVTHGKRCSSLFPFKLNSIRTTLPRSSG
jgi:hypothetical protein